MAPATSPPELPPIALDFLLFLGRAERTVADASSSGTTCEEDAQIWRAKVQAYEATLHAHLAKWEGLGEASIERYRSRIEDLSPSLERAFERRRCAAEAAAAAAAAPEAEAGAPEAEELLAEVPQADGDPILAQPSARVEQASTDHGGAVAAAVAAAAAAAQDAVPAADRIGCERAEADAPWRRRSGPGARGAQRPGSKAGVAGQMDKITDDLANMSEDMKRGASAFLVNLRKDDERLKEISQSQEKSLDNLEKQNEKGKKLLWSNQLGFFCTMAMLIISIVIFFMMIPFIIFT